ncbi:Six-hairpin glycosidase-like protein, partial [Thamnocephalis sphaerospora]
RYLRNEEGLNQSQASHLYVAYNANGELGDAVTTSEAHGYGMLIVAMYGKRSDFDGLLRYADYFRNARGLLGWQQRRDPYTGRLVPGIEGGENSATDGDVDCAAALWMAARRWSAECYAARARAWCDAILAHCVHPQRHTLLVGDWAHPRLTGAAAAATTTDASMLTRPSDYCLLYLTMFSSRHQERAMEWLQVVNATRRCINTQFHLHPQTGLVADFLVWDVQQAMYMPAPGKVLESMHDGHFYWNACRVPWRLAHYYLHTHDSAVEGHLRAFVRFLEANCANGLVYAGYQLDGRPLVNYTDLAFLAPAAFCLWVM